MKNLSSMGLKIEDGRVLVLDQQMLPDREIWLECTSPEQMASFIHSLKVRGAPLIGVAAAVAVAAFAERNGKPELVREKAALVRAARPTAVNLMWAIDRMMRESTVEGWTRTAERIFEEDIELCDSIGRHGADLIADGDGVLTHCNAGALATAGIGTAVGVIRRAHEQGKRIHVYVDETRPLLQGGRLTAWEMQKLGIPFTLICDNMAAILMRKGKIQKIVVGADRIAANGDFANKVGTYGVAVNAHHHGVKFYAAAPYSTVDLKCPSGDAIPIEERAADEVRGALGSFGNVRWAPEGSHVFNPSFDVTPADLMEGLILDRGYLSRAELKHGKLKELAS